MEWFGLEAALKVMLFQLPCHGQGMFHQTTLLGAPSNLALGVSRSVVTETFLLMLGEGFHLHITNCSGRPCSHAEGIIYMDYLRCLQTAWTASHCRGGCLSMCQGTSGICFRNIPMDARGGRGGDYVTP